MSLDKRDVRRPAAQRAMNAETAHRPSGPLALACSLAGIAGFIDVHLCLHVTNVFVANMSGNMVRVGIFNGSGDWSLAAGSESGLSRWHPGLVGACGCYVGCAAAASALGSSPLFLLTPSDVLLVFTVYVRSIAKFRSAFVKSRVRGSERRVPFSGTRPLAMSSRMCQARATTTRRIYAQKNIESTQPQAEVEETSSTDDRGLMTEDR